MPSSYLPTWHDAAHDPAHAQRTGAIRRARRQRDERGQQGRCPRRHADRRPLRRAGPALPDRRAQPLRPRDAGRAVQTVEEQYATRVDLDIEGNQRAVRDAIVQNGDALGRVVMRYDYDMLGNRIHQASMEAGERWMLNDVTGKPIRAWDSRGFIRPYDLRRTAPPDRPVRDRERPASGWPSTPSTARRKVDARQPPARASSRSATPRASSPATPTTSRATCCSGQRELLPDYKAAVNWRNPARCRRRRRSPASTHLRCAQPAASTRHHARQQRLPADAINEANLLERGRRCNLQRRGRGHAVRHRHRLRRQGPARADRLRQRRARRPTSTTR